MLDYPLLFVQRLGEHDLLVLAGLDDAGDDSRELRLRLSEDPLAVERHIADPRLFELLFEAPEAGPIQVLTPSLAFAVLVHKTMRDLGETSYVPEWVGAGERLPVFDVGSLRDFIDDTTRRYVIIDLLASFTKVASGSMWVRTSRGFRRRRYSELDPVSLAEMVESLPEDRRAPGYRRLGDVALFLTGVFPDHTERHPASPLRRARLAHTTGAGDGWDSGIGYLQFLETAGSRWYDRAADASFMPRGHREALHDLAVNFNAARRFLNFLADTYLHRFDTGLMNPVA
jgi:hypothetical protein